MDDLQNDDIFGDEGYVPCAAINPLVDVKAHSSVLVVEICQLKVCLQWVVGGRDVRVAPGLLDGQDIVLGDPTVLEETGEDDIFGLLNIVL